jgi:hypothetical protein
MNLFSPIHDAATVVTSHLLAPGPSWNDDQPPAT